MTVVNKVGFKHEALYAALRAEIGQALRPHDPLPSERELVARFGVSRATVRQAVGRLEEEGLVYRAQGSGTFVADPATISKNLALTSFSEDMRLRRLTPDSRLLDLTVIPAPVVVARDLAVSPGAEVVHARRLRLADGLPMCLEEVWLPAERVGELDAGVVAGSLYEVLAERGVRPHHADQVIAATVVDADQARLLGVAAFSPALRVDRITYDESGAAVERAESLYRADRYDFRITVTRRA
ncbi:GntR family transcriptional regulator [Micromonospora endolithica]|uniref:GntR family transcriptional regulator n=1 Tax=Micromonospora endolithica TaxID=230091 RepID=A0A3A9YX12_9ACTN|nr:GntR family transcriptional regulator [Micromonospora endolithica]RKN40568.1 GntR family transcriptional regulator [Micromonospora endolithica]TWJ21645.1 GntR family transcriptional regulator [Micromonospora endolithica]